MKKLSGLSFVVAVLALGVRATQAAEPAGSLTVHVNQPAAKIGPLFYGLMTEEINHSYDGGLYAELIQNRIFQDDPKSPAHWSVVGPATIALDTDKPVNNGALKTSLRLDIPSIANSQQVGVANDGYWGIPAWPNTKYHAAFYARVSDGFTGPLTISIQPDDGGPPLAMAIIPAVTTDWKKYEVDLTTGKLTTSTTNHFLISAGSKGSVWLSLVSLFPPTYNNRPNGNRIDLMQKLADLHPKFLRFPGGNFLEGNYVRERFNWKQTIGPLEDRPGHPGCWRYRASDGLGLLEFLGWCEDLHMEPLLAVYGGYSLGGETVKPGPDLEPFVQEDLDEIEYCTGDASTTWGARRIKDGHPAPFVIHYVEIGNEDLFDKHNTYPARFAQIFDAIKAKYPSIQCISTTAVKSRKADLVDDHDYPSPRQMLRTTARYENRDANLPKVFFGEWASQDGRPTPTMRAALADAAWLTGLQHASDTVLMNCYAPLLTNTNKGGWQWPTNLIGYDAANSFGSPSYYAQQMFTSNLGDVNLATDLTPQVTPQPPMVAAQGYIGLGTWSTSAEFKDVVVSNGTSKLFQSDFTGTGVPSGWKNVGDGNWNVQDGALQQTDNTRRDTRITTGDGSWQDYTLSVKARKISGAEGFLVMVHVRDAENMVRVNLGGWGNTHSALQQIEAGGNSEFGKAKPFTVETNRWYDIRVEVAGRDVKCFVDGNLIAQGKDEAATTPDHLFAVASRDSDKGDLILKIVNAGQASQQLDVSIDGANSIDADADLQVLQGQPADVNTVADPTKIAPVMSKLSGTSAKFTHEFPAYSVSVIRIHAK